MIYFVSRRLLDAETRYSPVERLCLCLYFSCTKLRHYLLSAECVVVSKDDVIRYMLSLPILKGSIGKWILALSEFDLRYESAKAVKGQAVADFVVQHYGEELNMVDLVPWTLFFDGSSYGNGSGIGVVLISPRGQILSSHFQLKHLQPTIKLSIVLFLRESKYFEKSKPMQLKFF